MTPLLLGILLVLAPAPTTPPPTEPETAQELPDTPIEKARSLLPAEFSEHQTRHWIILSDAQWDTIDHVGKHLEAAMHQFSRVCRLLGASRPDAVEAHAVHRLQRSRNAFRSFARAGDELEIDPGPDRGVLLSRPRNGSSSTNHEDFRNWKPLAEELNEHEEALFEDDELEEEDAREQARRINEHLRCTR